MIDDISELPEIQIFKTEKLNSNNKNEIIGNIYPWDRVVDSESKILHDIANRLGKNRYSKGTIRLYTQFNCCPSCRGVIKQFNSRYPNIKIEVIYERDFY